MSRPSNLTVSTIKRNQRLRGPTSSTQQNELQSEIVRDLVSIIQEYNTKIVPLGSTIPDGVEDPAVDAFSTGLDGKTLYVNATATASLSAGRFFNTQKDRPNTVYEQIQGLYDYVDVQIGTVDDTEGGGGVSDHGALSGLTDDDHTQYLLVNGSRATTGSLTVGGSLVLEEGIAPSLTAGFGKLYVKSSDSKLYFKDDSGVEYDLTSTGASDHGTLTGLTDDDHPQYLLIDGSRAMTGSLLPSANDTLNLGSTSFRWADIFLGPGTLHVGTSATDEGTISYNTTTNVLDFSTDSTSNGDIGFFTNVLYLDKSASSIGINNSSPSTTLDVTGTFRVTGNTTLGDAVGDTVTSNAGAWSFPNATTVAVTSTLNFDSNTLVIDATNNRVGIGTAAPSHDMTVERNAATSIFSVIRNPNAGNASAGFAAIAGATDNISFNVQTYAAGVNYGGLGGPVAALNAQSGTVALVFTHDGGSPIYFYVGNASSTTERLRITSTNYIFNEGGQNVDYRIEGNGRANLFYIDANAGTGGRVSINRTAGNIGATLDIDNLAVAESILIARDNGALVFSILDGGAVEVAEISAPSTPSSGFGRMYAKTDGKIYFLNDGGTEYDLTFGGSGSLSSLVLPTTTTTSSSFSVLSTHHTVRCDCTSNNITANLPAASSNTGLVLVIKKVDSTGNTVTIDGNGTDLIDGNSTLAISTQYGTYTVQSNGTGWDIL